MREYYGLVHVPGGYQGSCLYKGATSKARRSEEVSHDLLCSVTTALMSNDTAMGCECCRQRSTAPPSLRWSRASKGSQSGRAGSSRAPQPWCHLRGERPTGRSRSTTDTLACMKGLGQLQRLHQDHSIRRRRVDFSAQQQSGSEPDGSGL